MSGSRPPIPNACSGGIATIQRSPIFIFERTVWAPWIIPSNRAVISNSSPMSVPSMSRAWNETLIVSSGFGDRPAPSERALT